MSFTLPGAPVTKKNSPRIGWRWVRGGRRPVLLPSKAFCNWRDGLLPYARWIAGNAKRQGHPVPLTSTVRVDAVFYRRRATGDMDNFEAALGDLLQDADFIKNDRLIQWGRVQLAKDAAHPRIEVTLTY